MKTSDKNNKIEISLFFVDNSIYNLILFPLGSLSFSDLFLDLFHFSFFSLDLTGRFEGISRPPLHKPCSKTDKDNSPIIVNHRFVVFGVIETGEGVVLVEPGHTFMCEHVETISDPLNFPGNSLKFHILIGNSFLSSLATDGGDNEASIMWSRNELLFEETNGSHTGLVSFYLYLGAFAHLDEIDNINAAIVVPNGKPRTILVEIITIDVPPVLGSDIQLTLEDVPQA